MNKHYRVPGWYEYDDEFSMGGTLIKSAFWFFVIVVLVASCVF